MEGVDGSIIDTEKPGALALDYQPDGYVGLVFRDGETVVKVKGDKGDPNTYERLLKDLEKQVALQDRVWIKSALRTVRCDSLVNGPV